MEGRGDAWAVSSDRRDETVNLDWLYRLYAWAIGYMAAVIVALGVIAALASYLVWLVVIVVLLIAARLVWWYTRW